MRLKSYFVPSVGAALALARQELGPDAVLLEARKAPPEAAHLGQYEVVFAISGGPRGVEPASTAQTEPGREAVALERLRTEVTQLRRQLERMNAAVACTKLAGGASPTDEFSAMLARLLEAEVDGDLAAEVLQAARARTNVASAPEIEPAILEELASRCRVDGGLGRSEQSPRIAVLVGPSGAGKTTALVKLAVREGLQKGRSVQLISVDNYRVGGAEQLRSFATILGVAFQYVETPLALSHALRECRRKDLILIDTPGYGPAEAQEAAELAGFLAGRDEIDVHLVLTASTRSADLRRVAERFEPFRPQKLLFTRLDETEAYGGLWSLAARTGKPVSFLSAGQRIPEDLEPASVNRIVELLWRGQPARVVAAAA